MGKHYAAPPATLEGTEPLEVILAPSSQTFLFFNHHTMLATQGGLQSKTYSLIPYPLPYLPLTLYPLPLESPWRTERGAFPPAKSWGEWKNTSPSQGSVSIQTPLCLLSFPLPQKNLYFFSRLEQMGTDWSFSLLNRLFMQGLKHFKLKENNLVFVQLYLPFPEAVSSGMLWLLLGGSGRGEIQNNYWE